MTYELTRRELLSGCAGIAAGVPVATQPVVGEETTSGDGIWVFETDDFVVSSPTVVEGTVYFGSNDEAVYAVDAETGDKEWTFTGADGTVRSSPAVVDDTVYIGSDDGALYSIAAESGEENWSTDINTGGLASPTVADEAVYVLGDTLHALSTDTGEELWELDAHEDSVFYTSSPVIHDGSVYIGSGGLNSTEGCRIYAVNAETGLTEWSAEAPTGDVRTAPTIAEEMLYVGAGTGLDNDHPDDETLYAINLQTGEPEWTFETNGVPSVSPTVANGTVYIGTSEEYQESQFRGTLHAIDASTGEEQWQFHDDDTNIASSPTVADGTVYFGCSGLYAIDSDTGDERWQFGDPAVGRSSPTVVDGIVFFGLDDGYLYAIDAGVDESSEGSRVRLGGLGHHHEWADTSGQSLNPVVSWPPDDADAENGAAAVFRQFSSAADSRLLWILSIVGGGSAAYVGYQKFDWGTTGDEPAHKDQANGASVTTGVAQTDSPTITGYGEIELLDTVEQLQSVRIQWATADGKEVWILSPESEATLRTSSIDQTVSKIEPWAKMDAHPNLLSVFDMGTEPLPWVVIEPAEYPLFSDCADQLSTAKILNAVQQICNAVHHVYRYGASYENLTTDRILYANSSNIILQGIIDQFRDDNVWYAAPEELDGKQSERTIVYRIGVIAYEALTGTLPYEMYPTGDAKSTIQTEEISPPSQHVEDLPQGIDKVLCRALSKSPMDRHETVLHLHDDIDKI